MTDDTDKRKRENTRERLIIASAKVFADKGVAGATVDDLVNAAGFTRGAFYSNFSSKEEVFAEALSEFTRGMVGAVQQGIEAQGDNISTVEAMRTILQSLRPLGRIWVLLEAEAIRVALQDDDVRQMCVDMRDYLSRALISIMAARGLTLLGAQSSGSLEELKQIADLLLSIYTEALIVEQIEGTDSTERLIGMLSRLFPIEAGE
ncbi:MAG: TetR/AcrR family transcriptional regulator [Actinomycetaceae bacterium]|nr:TetR/AcrR family transcriptional regulator [Actinomycetaceae bacterium]